MQVCLTPWGDPWAAATFFSKVPHLAGRSLYQYPVCPVKSLGTALQRYGANAGIDPKEKQLKTSVFFSFLFLTFIHFLRDRERQYEWGKERERKGDIESEAGSRLCAVSTEPNTGLEPRIVRSWFEELKWYSPVWTLPDRIRINNVKTNVTFFLYI